MFFYLQRWARGGIALRALYFPAMVVALICPEVLAASVTFDLEAFSSGLAAGVDISRFNRHDTLAPGKYRVDVTLNGAPAGRHALDFIAVQDDVVPCLDWPLLTRLGVAPNQPVSPGPLCGDLGQWIPMASSSVDSGALQLALSVPQLYLTPTARDAIDPRQWDEGINAGLLSYNFSASTMTAGRGEDRAYLGLNTGLNLGSWRLRHQGAQAWDSRSGAERYQSSAIYVQRSLAAWQSRLTLGDSFSSGQILESTRMRGLSLGTDEQMLAPSQQGYAPVVRGMADSNATVTVSQNGYTLYETTVAPGPFVINDLYPTGGGDLSVSVKEIDGRQYSYSVPFSVAPHLLRRSASRYGMTLGQVRQNGVEGRAPLAFEGTLQHGLLDDLTLYGGSSFSEGYAQGKAGVALNTTLGAFSLDATDSRTHVPGQGVLSGQNVGLGFDRQLSQTGTHLVLGAYRFSTEGYLNLTDAVNVRELGRRGQDIGSYARQKTRLDLTISQQAGAGTLGFYASSTQYWGPRLGRETAYHLSYGASWRRLNWNLSAQRSRVQAPDRSNHQDEHAPVLLARSDNAGHVDNRVMLTVSLPLGSSPRAPSLTSTLIRSTGGSRGSQQQLGINGMLDDDATLNYGIAGTRASAEGASQGSFNAYAGYNASTAALRLGYGQNRDSSQLSLSADGGLVAHADGLTFSHYLGEAAALVHVPAAQGARLSNGNHLRVDRNGYAVVPSLRAFQANTVGIDPEGSAYDVELQETSQRIVPTAGAIARLSFATVVGRAVVVKALRENGKPLPFAAQVFDEHGSEVGVIGQASKAFVRGIAEQGTLTVKWSETAADRCYIHYRLQPQATRRQAHADLLQGQCVGVAAGREVTAR